MSEAMKWVEFPAVAPEEFTFSNITNASIKFPFKHHAYFSITITLLSLPVLSAEMTHKSMRERER